MTGAQTSAKSPRRHLDLASRSALVMSGIGSAYVDLFRAHSDSAACRFGRFPLLVERDEEGGKERHSGDAVRRGEKERPRFPRGRRLP